MRWLAYPFQAVWSKSIEYYGVTLLEKENGITDEELGEWVERKTVRQQRRIEGDK